MDKFDARILDLVQRNNRMTAEDMGEAVGLSPAACQKRLKKLRDRGVIEADIAVLAPEAVSRGLTMIVEVSLERERAAFLDAFKASMLKAPEVMQCYYVTGSADFILILTVRDMQDYDAFTRRHFFAESNVSRFRTNVVMDRVKVGLSVPVEVS
ncbi:Lrp/AsnC family transcriptional regulator [Fodinicurvata sp. EGI_FJ10296]|uniref:Lrp/AsnC family transcriptional regulator n=1 Tax=Fodinicurvata sp. EGI_FJ10296 TaxID=3231908 RepID=UPI003451C598